MIEMMSSVVARAATMVRAGNSGGTLYRTEYFGCEPGRAGFPQAFLIESQGGRQSRAHFHAVDQWQIVVAGSGRLGRHHVAPLTIHYARAFTPYGPIWTGPHGLSFFTLRASHDAGAQRLPEARGRLGSQRQPFQVSRDVTPADSAALAVMKDAAWRSVPGIDDGCSVAAYVLTAGPNVTTTGPNPADGGGQFYLVTQGGLLWQRTELPVLSCLFLSADESPPESTAGASGLEALVLQFARKAQAETGKAAAATGRKWQCVLCAFAYDEAAGLPADDIAPGTRWQDVPNDWTCPDCGAAKSDFEPTRS